MPRRKMGFDEAPLPADAGLVTRLTDEIKSNRDSGQPLIYERSLSKDRIAITVIWDAWANISLEERTKIILKAYEQSEGPAYRAKIALCNGLTVPEAHAAGMLPYQVIPALRKSDQFTPDECRKAMLEEGATTLFGPDIVQLRFASQEEAEQAVKRLGRRLSGSEPIWIISREISAYDFARASELPEIDLSSH